MSTEEAYELQSKILHNELSEAALLDVFATLDRPLSEDEFYGLYKASAEAMTTVETTIATVDTCGTGGDGLNTFNISTAASMLVASLGVPVAKHGNRSASGNCGSADVLATLGVRIDMTKDQIAESLERTGFCFMFAPTFHLAFKNAATARKKFGKRTYFNYLGPLLNPASAPYRLVGVSDHSMVAVIGATLMRTGVAKAWIVRSEDGMDEISPTGDTTVSEFVPEKDVRTFTINPTACNIALATQDSLMGGDAAHNATIIRNVLRNQGTPAQTDTVVLNAAGALVVAGGATDYSQGLTLSYEALHDGRAAAKLQEIIDFSNTLPVAVA